MIEPKAVATVVLSVLLAVLGLIAMTALTGWVFMATLGSLTDWNYFQWWGVGIATLFMVSLMRVSVIAQLKETE